MARLRSLRLRDFPDGRLRTIAVAVSRLALAHHVPAKLVLPVIPLPRYTIRKRLKSGPIGYFFSTPTWARKKGCPVKNEALGTDHTLAVDRVEKVLLPAFDSWRRTGGDDANPVGIGVVIGTL